MPKLPTAHRPLTTDLVQPSVLRSLNRLHGRISRCHLCFKRCENIPVTGKGLARTGGLCFIGQAPGIREPAAQMNFAWTAGRRLFKWLSTIGLSEASLRKYAYITAVTKCYPGKSKSGTGDRKPTPVEVAACAPFLDGALTLLKPRVVVPIGALAVERLLGEKSMSVTIGREYRKDLPGGESFIIPLPHPSGASPWAHMPGNREKLEIALALIRRRIRREGISGWFQDEGSA